MAYYSNKVCNNCGKEDNDWRQARCGKCLEKLSSTDKRLELIEVEDEPKPKANPWWSNVLPFLGAVTLALVLAQEETTTGATATSKTVTQVVSDQKKSPTAKPASKLVPKVKPSATPQTPLPSRDVLSPTRVHGEVYVHDHFDGKFHTHGPFDPPHKDTRNLSPPPQVTPRRNSPFASPRAELRRTTPSPPRVTSPLDQLFR